MAQCTASYSCSLRNINGHNKSEVMEWARRVSSMGRMRNTDTVQEHLNCVWFR